MHVCLVQMSKFSTFPSFSKRAELCFAGLTGRNCGCCKISASPHAVVNILLALTADLGPEEPDTSTETFAKSLRVLRDNLPCGERCCPPLVSH